ncbi:MAG: MlaE family lipid ABC transporter permease subunit [Proteobacteria bacterium]|nr:MlaE family lipid ABC transporter permease subunit [Pseudomonadota bacterium]MCZ6782928.1 MlaE family lipid ABC transporter permease subunit [Pseudomonadota bacterium]
MTGAVARLGARSVDWVAGLGHMTRFAGSVVAAALRPPLRGRTLVREIYDVGVRSLALILGSGFVVGMVLGLQAYNTLARFGAEQSLGAVVGLSLIRELGPVLTGLLVTGRAGSATAAGIGAMVTTGQLDGLRMMSISPIHFVVYPKALALLIAMPLLSALFIVVGVFGGYVVVVELLGLDPGSYLSSLENAVDFRDDVLASVLKGVVFGLLAGLISTYRGYTSEPTAEGVSRSTTSTVVVASVCILISNYFITALWGV